MITINGFPLTNKQKFWLGVLIVYLGFMVCLWGWVIYAVVTSLIR